MEGARTQFNFIPKFPLVCYTEYKQLSRERERERVYGADDLMEKGRDRRGGGYKKKEIEGESERISYGPQNMHTYILF